MTPPIDPSRARFVRTPLDLAAAGAPPRRAFAQAPTTMATRKIPSSGEALPVIGCGTWIGFDVADGSREMGSLFDVDVRAATWSQVLLKFVLSHVAVTCAIPGTGNPRHMAENARAGVGPGPDRAERQADEFRRRRPLYRGLLKASAPAAPRARQSGTGSRK